MLAPAFGQEAIIFEQSEAPLEIISYRTGYIPPDRAGDGSIRHSVTVRNNLEQNVEAYGIGFYIFDAFNRSMDRPFVGYAMNPIGSSLTDNPRWEQRARSAFLYDGHGQGIAYVAIVRFEDGTIWEASESDILRQLDDFELELSEEIEVID
jgi:hypothetical protein